MIDIAPGYRLSEDGKVYSSWGRGVKAPTSEYRELKYGKDAKGYLSVNLCISGKCSTKRIHRLVAEHYIPNPNNLPCVRHKDGSKDNNHKDNLAWSTYLENEHDKKNHGTYKLRVGGRKLSDEDIQFIKRNKNQYSQKELAMKFNVSRPTITRLLNGTIWCES